MCGDQERGKGRGWQRRAECHKETVRGRRRMMMDVVPLVFCVVPLVPCVVHLVLHRVHMAPKALQLSLRPLQPSPHPFPPHPTPPGACCEGGGRPSGRARPQVGLHQETGHPHTAGALVGVGAGAWAAGRSGGSGDTLKVVRGPTATGLGPSWPVVFKKGYLLGHGECLKPTPLRNSR